MAKKEIKSDTNLKDSIDELKSISEWFEAQNDIDIELGLQKIKEGAVLVKNCKARLKDLENTFEEIKKELDSD